MANFSEIGRSHPRRHAELTDDELQMIDATVLYNLMQQVTTSFISLLSDPNHLLIIDTRKRIDYEEGHVITAKWARMTASGSIAIPNLELDCKRNVVVYDNTTAGLTDAVAPAVDCGRLLYAMGSRNKVNILKGGYEEFLARYPFLRTHKTFYMPRELDEIKPYPFEILPGLLYIGNWRQGNDPEVLKDLHIKAHICISMEDETLWPGRHPDKLRVKMEDSDETPIFKCFSKTLAFIENRIGRKAQPKQAVLVFDRYGFSLAATVVLAYLMKSKKTDLDSAWQHVKKCMPTLRPNRGFVKHLSTFEVVTLGAKSTDINDPNF
ncbi:hypothetical protein BaRGS_00020866 [Batillaria attramentaria]|uniref:Uncharacterized protein n=1 Tax=Batillaria attramentaria TaxID=370345 RepID=A0ABD0KL83_9CAEN